MECHSDQHPVPREGKPLMGYPMTWQRVIARNGLGDGDYSHAPERWQSRANTKDREPLSPDVFTGVPEAERDATVLKTTQDLSNYRADRVEGYENAARSLAGDLRRLEQDIADEGAICKEIARRTDIDADIVAAILKEFLNV